MSNKVQFAFEMQGIVIPIANILCRKMVSKTTRGTVKYRSIAASIREIGIIEPPVVYPEDKKKGTYLLLDGHLRIDVLKEMGETEVFCLISTDDESYTYNKIATLVATIQEHFMIMKVIEHGVSEERIAKALNVDVAKIKQKMNLIHDICPEAVDLLKDKHIVPEALRVMKKVKAMRQIEMAELMISANNYSLPYANALFAATPSDQLAETVKAKEVAGIKPEDLARMEKEMEKLKDDYKLHEDAYGQSVLILVQAVGYVNKLLNNAKVVRYFSNNSPETLQEFQKIVEAVSLES